MKIKIPKGSPKKSRGTWHRKPVTQVKDSAKAYKREKEKQKDLEWGMEEFVESVDAVMQNQEKQNPAIKQIHAKLSPDWKRVSNHLARLLSLTGEAEIEKLREEIVAEGEIASRVLIDFVLAIKNQTKV